MLKEIKLLFVDDDEVDMMAFKRFFKKDNKHFIYDTATSITMAKQMIISNNYDVVVTDFNLGDGTALELFIIDPNIPYIVVTGAGNEKIAVKALKEGAYDYIVKGKNGEHLKLIPLTIENAVYRKGAERELIEYQENLASLVKERTIKLELEIEMHKKTEEKLIQAEKNILKAKHAIIFALADLAESRDNETGAHLIRIREYCKALSTRLSLTDRYKDQIDDSFIEDIFNTSVLHDIGKVGIPDAILLKPGKLTEEEFEVMKKHPEIGGKTLEAVYNANPNQHYLKMATDIALSHHERWNGTGYPKGLKGEEISLAARITTFADIFDALMSRRTYKDPFTIDKTFSIMEAEKGKILDPNIFPYFREIYDIFVQIHDERSNETSTTFDMVRI